MVISKFLFIIYRHFFDFSSSSSKSFVSAARGFDQQEVTCNPNIRDKSAYWSIEDNRYPRCKMLILSTLDVW